MEQSLLLDSALRDWVLLPITLVMVLVGIFRNNLMKLLEGKPKLSTLTAARQQYVPQSDAGTFSRAQRRCV